MVLNQQPVYYLSSVASTPGWSQSGFAMPEGINPTIPQFYMACTGYEQSVFLMGGAWFGSANSYSPTDGVWRFDPARFSSGWEQRASMLTAVVFAAADESGDRIYLCGGLTGGMPSTLLQIFDIAGNTWTNGPNMPVGRAYLSVSALKPSRSSCSELIFAMGADSDEPTISVFNTGTQRWFDGRDLFGNQFAFPNPGGPQRVLQGTMTTSDRQIFAVGSGGMFKTQIP